MRSIRHHTHIRMRSILHQAILCQRANDLKGAEEKFKEALAQV